MIERTGGPRAVATRGEKFEVEVPLNTAPSWAWVRAFNDPKGFSSMHVPHAVRFEGAFARFKSREGDIADWVEWIDSWIKNANEACRQADITNRQKLTAAKQAQAERDQQLAELNDRLKEKYQP